MTANQSAPVGHHNASQELIYKDLLAALNKSSSSGNPAKFELLLESHPLPSGTHVLIEEDTIGVPRRSLRKAYLFARQLFFKELEKPSPNSETILGASAVLLLYEPEHLTAANARKRLLLGLEKQSETEFNEAVKKEFWLLNTLFQSPLNRHTKSPTLWGHRRWLMQKIPRQTRMEIEKEIIEVIFSAAQIHPKNYYAWDYMRWWVDRYPDLLSNFDRGVQSQPASVNIAEMHFPSLIQDWCLKHPSDTSGWSFLLRILTSHATTAFISTGIAEQVLDTVVSLKLRNESLWLFLRTLMASKYVTSDMRKAYLAEVNFIAQSESERPSSRLLAETLLKSSEMWVGDGTITLV